MQACKVTKYNKSNCFKFARIPRQAPRLRFQWSLSRIQLRGRTRRDERSEERAQPLVLRFGLTALSSFFYFFALHFDSLFFLIFVFLIPLLFLKRTSFVQGFLWGVVFYSFHFFSIFKIFFSIDHAYWFFPPLILILYFALWSGIWFFVNSKIQSKSDNELKKVFAFAPFTLLYFLFVDYFILSFIEFGCGYAVSSPLNTLYFLGCLQPRFLYLFLIIVLNILIFLFFKEKKVKYLIAFFFILASIFYRKPTKEFNLKNSKIISFYEKAVGPLERILEIKKSINRSLKENNKIKNMFFPETTFPFAINENIYLLKWLPKNVNIFLCCHWKKSNKLLNCVLHIFDGKIINKYYKKRLVPVVEYTPNFLKFIPGLKNQFLKDSIEFIPGKRNNIFIVNGKKFRVLVCSDLFFNSIFNFDRESAVFFMNNTWFDKNYQNLLFKTIMVIYSECLIISY